MVPKYFILTFTNLFINKVIAEEYQCAFRPLLKDEMPSRWNSQIKQMFRHELTKLEAQLEKKFEEKFAMKQSTSPTVEWIETTVGDANSLIDRAVLGGYDYDGSPLWIIKGSIYNTMTIGKLHLKTKKTFYAHNATEYFYTGESIVTKVLCAPLERVRWVESRNGYVPPNAVVGGITDNEERIYIGRAKEQGSLIPGPIYPKEQALYVTFAGKNIKHEIYEVLCLV